MQLDEFQLPFKTLIMALQILKQLLALFLFVARHSAAVEVSLTRITFVIFRWFDDSSFQF